MADAGGKGAEPKSDQEKKVERRSTYIAIQWAIQIGCGLFCFLLVLWSTIQMMRVWNILGVGEVPPGLQYGHVDV